MSEDEVREEFSTFLEHHPDGKIHKREFKKMLEKVGNLVVLLIHFLLKHWGFLVIYLCSDAAWTRRNLYAEAHLPMLRREREWLH